MFEIKYVTDICSDILMRIHRNKLLGKDVELRQIVLSIRLRTSFSDQLQSPVCILPLLFKGTSYFSIIRVERESPGTVRRKAHDHAVVLRLQDYYTILSPFDLQIIYKIITFYVSSKLSSLMQSEQNKKFLTKQINDKND